MIYLHVGLPKVASTTIQRFLSRNAAVLARHGYLYPALTEGRELGVSDAAQNALAIELRRGRPGRVWQRLHEILDRRSPGEHVVLSGESFLGCGPGTLREALGGHPVTVLVYVRDFLRLIPSQYAHLTKQGLSTVDFDAYLARALSRPVCDLPGLARQWAGVFGAGRVRMRMLDPRALAGGDVQTDILDAMDLALDPSELDRVPSANAGLGWKTVEILRDFHLRLAGGAPPEGEAGHDQRAEQRRQLQARKQRRGSPVLDFGAALSNAAAPVGDEMGFTQRGDWFTADQIDHCVTLFNAQVAEIRASGIANTLRRVDAEGIAPRQFLPSVAAIPPEEVAGFLRRIMPVACRLLLDGGEGTEGEAAGEAAPAPVSAAARQARQAARRQGAAGKGAAKAADRPAGKAAERLAERAARRAGAAPAPEGRATEARPAAAERLAERAARRAGAAPAEGRAAEARPAAAERLAERAARRAGAAPGPEGRPRRARERSPDKV
jgi:hypothetical protein